MPSQGVEVAVSMKYRGVGTNCDRGDEAVDQLPDGLAAPTARAIQVLAVCSLIMFLMMRSMDHGHVDHAGHQGHPDDRTLADKPVDW